MLVVLFFYAVLINLTAIVVTVWDKLAAKSRRRRVPEARLFWIAAFGGAGAMWLTMWVIRHKTKKRKFMIGLPLLFLLHIAVIVGVALNPLGLLILLI